MTEGEWLNRSQLAAMLGVPRRAGCPTRKLHLAGVAFCRQLWHLPLRDEWREVVDTVERWVEGRATETDVSAVEAPLYTRRDDILWESQHRARLVRNQGPLRDYEEWHAYCGALYLARLSPAGAKDVGYHCAKAWGIRRMTAARVAQCELVRDIFGNPFRPVAFDPSWRTSTAVAVAQQMYESREFGAMPILADALQDAGCDHADILAHCRDPHAAHVRGCWVVDLVLGKG